MIDKGIVVMMVDRGRSLTSIAKKFNVSTTRIWKIVTEIKYYSKKEKEVRCDVCMGIIEKKVYVKIGDGLKKLIVCGDCKREIKEDS